MTHQESIQGILRLFRAHDRFVVTAHAQPDGDSIGSCLAVAEILDQLGREVDIVFADPIPKIYASLPNVNRIRHSSYAENDRCAVIILECDSIQRTGLLDLEGRFLINIDHHASGRTFGAFNWIDEKACAVAAMIYDIAEMAQIKITPSIATCLYTAILSDTGSFTNAGTSAETLKLAHTLALKGANPSQIARDVFFSAPVNKIRLLGTALSNLVCEGQVAWSWVTQQNIEDAHAVSEDCEGVINHLIGIEGVESAVFFRELAHTNQFRLSLRSKGLVDVSLIAENFGGGGHRTASGCTLEGPLPVAVERVLKVLRDRLC